VKKNLIRKAVRVPIDLMAALQRGDLRAPASTPIVFGTDEVIETIGGDLTPYNRTNSIRRTRSISDRYREWRKNSPRGRIRGLNPRYLEAAEKSSPSPPRKPKFVRQDGPHKRCRYRAPRSIFSNMHR
jgi:hypothetical protein